MSCKTRVRFVSFPALVALEWSRLNVFQSVFLQMTRCRAKVVALVTLERLFASMHTHNVVFQMTSCNARKLAQFALVWFFSGMRFLVYL